MIHLSPDLPQFIMFLVNKINKIFRGWTSRIFFWGGGEREKLLILGQQLLCLIHHTIPISGKYSFFLGYLYPDRLAIIVILFISFCASTISANNDSSYLVTFC